MAETLASGSDASASTVASRIAATLRSASARRFAGLGRERLAAGGIVSDQWIDAGRERANFGRNALAPGTMTSAAAAAVPAITPAARNASDRPAAADGLPVTTAPPAMLVSTASPSDP